MLVDGVLRLDGREFEPGHWSRKTVVGPWNKDYCRTWRYKSMEVFHMLKVSLKLQTEQQNNQFVAPIVKFWDETDFRIGIWPTADADTIF